MIVNTRQDYLNELAKLLPPACIGVEIGVLYGDFSQMILNAICPKHLVLVDPYETSGNRYESGIQTAYSTQSDYQKLLKRFHEQKLSGQVNVVRLHSSEAQKIFNDGSFDFIYHDASHLLVDVKRDLNEWLPKLKEGGLMCGHDYIDHQDFGVIEAVNNFCNKHNFEMILFNTDGGDYALRRKA